MTHSFAKLVTAAAVSVVCAFAVGCAAPTSSDEGTSAEDLSSSARPPSSTAVGGAVHDPLCIEHKVKANICVFDYEWRARALTVCEAEHKKLESFDIVVACGVTDPPSTSAADPTNTGGSSASGAAGSGGNGSSTAAANASAVEVEFACCNGGVEPPIRPTSAVRPADAI